MICSIPYPRQSRRSEPWYFGRPGKKPLPPPYWAVAVETMVRRNRPTAIIPRNLRATCIPHLQLDRNVRQRRAAKEPSPARNQASCGCVLRYVPMLSLYHMSRHASTHFRLRGYGNYPAKRPAVAEAAHSLFYDSWLRLRHRGRTAHPAYPRRSHRRTWPP